MNEREVLDLLEAAGAVRSGHFLLSSGKHSGVYVEKARMFERPADTMRLADEVASWHDGVDVVVSPAVGAVPFGFAVALASGARFVYAEREDGPMAFRRGFRLEPGERALVVEDVVTTGGSAAEVRELVEAAGAEALGVAAMVDRSVEPVAFAFRALARIEAEVFERADCPLCRDGVPLESPGSRHG
ncbi:MAG: orotate phosphoribosyltransferase [Actinomycetota bacterium]